MNLNQGWQLGTVRQYGTVRLKFCLEVWCACTLRVSYNGTGTVRRYAFGICILNVPKIPYLLLRYV